jgi:hypothetical protein
MNSADTKIKSCFIIGPIGEAGSGVRRVADWLLKGIIKPVLEHDEFNYLVKRADDDANPGSITNAVIADITNADLVIADLTGFNPNAFYELGIRHTLKKPVIHIIAEQVKLPFDNADQRTIFIDIGDIDNVESAKASLAKAVRLVSTDGYKVTNPVTLAGAISEFGQSADPEKQIVADVVERLSSLERNIALFMSHNRNVYNPGKLSRATELLKEFGQNHQTDVGSILPYAAYVAAFDRVKGAVANKDLSQLTSSADPYALQDLIEKAIAGQKID